MKKTCIYFLVLVLGITASACKPPEPEETTLNFSNTTGQAQTPVGEANGLQTSNNYQLEATEPKLEGSMKQLSDFEPIEGTSVTFTTTKGDITIDLFRAEAPLTTLNFLTLVKDGFYDGIVFHRVIPDFMAQVGDPLTKEAGKEALWGTGGPGYSIADEFNASLKHDSAGILSMANSGPNTGGSQIFITYEATPWLDGKHAVFGKVTSGMDVLEKITIGDKIISASYK